MIKNTASQKIGAQLVSASDGSAFTSAVTVVVTVDAGTQATGTVGAGACTHEGNGYHTYAPSQAETNGDLIAFTFTGSGAVPVTVQVYTVAGDAFTRLGAPAGASVSADVAAVKVDTAAILVDTGTTLDARIPAALISGRMDATVGAMQASVLTSTAIAPDAITDAKVASDVTIASVTGAVGSVTGNVGGNVTGSVGSLATQAKADVNAEVLDVLVTDILADSVPSDGTRPSIAQAMYMVVQFLTERSVTGTTVTVRKVDGSTALYTLTLNDGTTPTSVTR